MLTEKDFSAFVRLAKQAVNDVWRPKEMLPPICRVYAADGPRTGIPVPIDDIPEEVHWPILRLVCKQLDAYAIMQVREVWIAAEDVPEGLSSEEVRSYMKERRGLPPSQREDRREAVLVAWEYQRKCGISQCPITRNEEGEGTLGEWTDAEDVEGRMVRLLAGKGDGAN